MTSFAIVGKIAHHPVKTRDLEGTVETNKKIVIPIVVEHADGKQEFLSVVSTDEKIFDREYTADEPIRVNGRLVGLDRYPGVQGNYTLEATYVVFPNDKK